MKKLLCAFWTGLLASTLSQAQGLAPPIEQWARQTAVTPAQLSVFVQEIGSARPVVSFNAEAPQNPASLMKLVTTFAALEVLGPAATWKTTLASAASQNRDVLEGDLYIRGGGDPKLRLKDLWSLLRQLRLLGIREIRGDILLDRSLFALPESDPGKFDGEALRPYNVAPDALMINFKSVAFQFRLDETGNWKVSADPRPLGLSVQANIRATDNGCGDWKAALTSQFNLDAKPPRAVFGGSIPKSCGDQDLYRALFSNQQYAAGTVRQVWEDSGGKLTGMVKEGVMPPNARVLAEQESEALAEIVRDINKRSNNLMARTLYLNLGLSVPNAGPFATLERSRVAMQQWMTGRGLNFPELVIENGSGLSREERIAPANLGRMLVAAFASPVMPEYLASLPLVATDGTMKKRLKATAVAGYAHIKTGTLTGVRAIGGYVLTASGRRYAVVSIVNGDTAANAQSLQDQLLSWLFDNG